MVQRTLCLIKPDAVARNRVGAILAMIEAKNLKIVAMSMKRLSLAEAEGFYAVHKERPFFGELTEYMCSGPLVAVALEGENAIAVYRELMGATNPQEAAEGTIRKIHAQSLQANSVHGSDGPETAATEIAYFFNQLEMVGSGL